MLDGSPDVIELFNTDKWPFVLESSGDTSSASTGRPARDEDIVMLYGGKQVLRPDAIRIQRYLYDFTRLDTPWARRLPLERQAEAVLPWGSFAAGNRSTGAKGAMQRHLLLLAGHFLGSKSASTALSADGPAKQG